MITVWPWRKNFGAIDVITSSIGDSIDKILTLIEGKGVDVAMEAVGIPLAVSDVYQVIIVPGGRIANTAVHGKKADLAWPH